MEDAEIEVQGNEIVITWENLKKQPCKLVVDIFAFFLTVIKMSASLGLRLYGLWDLLTNRKYIYFQPIFSYIPRGYVTPICASLAVPDAVMNALTRGDYMHKKLSECFANKKNKIQIYNNSSREYKNTSEKLISYSKKPAKYFINFCGIISLLGLALTNFLGIATLMELATSDVYIVMVVAIIAVIVNSFSNISYRIKKANDNLDKIYNKELHRPHWWQLFIILFGSIAFLGFCDYGVSHSLRKLFSLAGWYNGNPDTHNEEKFWEKIIYGVTNASLPPAIIMFVLAQCCEMLDVKKNNKAGSTILNYKNISSKYHRILKNKGVSVWHFPSNYLPFFVRILVDLNYLLVPGELLGNGLLHFNGITGLIFRLVTKNPWAVGVIALFTTLVMTYIYWHFNISNWINGVRKQLVKAIFYSLRKMYVRNGHIASDENILSALGGETKRRRKGAPIYIDDKPNPDESENGFVKAKQPEFLCNLFKCCFSKKAYQFISENDEKAFHHNHS